MFIYFRLFPPSKEMKFCPFFYTLPFVPAARNCIDWIIEKTVTLSIYTQNIYKVYIMEKYYYNFSKLKMSDFLKETTVNEAWMSVVIWQLSHHSARFLMIIIVSIVSKLSLFGGTQKLMPSFAFNKLLLFYSTYEESNI